MERSLTGRTALVTGGTGGIGLHTARFLARRGAHLVITGHEADAGDQAAAALRAETPDASVTFVHGEHATVGGNEDVADEVRRTVPGLDILITNVGGLNPARWETADGYEATLAMNFVGPLTLTGSLLPLLRAAAPARCVNVVSGVFRTWRADPFEDVSSTEHFVRGEAYSGPRPRGGDGCCGSDPPTAGRGVKRSPLHIGLNRPPAPGGAAALSWPHHLQQGPGARNVPPRRVALLTGEGISDG